MPSVPAQEEKKTALTDGQQNDSITIPLFSFWGIEP